MHKSSYVFIIKVLFIWFAGLFLTLYISTKILPLQNNFIGGGVSNYTQNYFFWVWGNFDGEHYLSIAHKGYQDLTYFFFPLYPMLISLLSKFIGNDLAALNVSGILISITSFVLSLVGFYKLLKIDFDEKITKISILLLILFPMSFYLVSIYTESLFLALTVWSFYFARKGNWAMAATLGCLLTATRIIGIVILPALLVEWYSSRKPERVAKQTFPYTLLVIPLGVVSYMYYLKLKTGDMLEFITNVGVFGAQRSDHFIYLPQVFYRYIFKILPNLHTTYFPIVFSTFMEFFIGLSLLIVIIYSVRKIRFSYWIFLTLGYLIPTLSGSFSSLPRYVLVLFPIYIILANLISKSRLLLFAFTVISTILLVVSFALFARGYWIS